MKTIEELAAEVLEERYFGGADREAIENMIIEALRKQKDEIFGEQKQCRFGLSEECGNLCWQMPHHYLKIREQLLQQDKDGSNSNIEIRGGPAQADSRESTASVSPETEDVCKHDDAEIGFRVEDESIIWFFFCTCNRQWDSLADMIQDIQGKGNEKT